MLLLNSSNFFILNFSLSPTSCSKKNPIRQKKTNKPLRLPFKHKLKSTQIIGQSITLLTSINRLISCTFSLFFSLKASRASLYSLYFLQCKIKAPRNIIRMPKFLKALVTCFTFFWQVWPSGFNSLLTASIFFLATETSFFIGSASASSSW